MSISSKFLSIRSRLMLMLILVSAISAMVLIYIGYVNGKNAINESIFNQLTSVKASKKYQIESYFHEIGNITEILGENEMIAQALSDFKSGYRQIGKTQLSSECSQKLSSHYDDFVDHVSQNMDIKNNPELYYPKSIEACYLQYEYIIENPNPAGDKHLLLDANDESDYNKAHIKYHQYLTDVILKFGFYDIFLIDLERGDIVYTAYKETDFATNLYSGPYKESNLAELTRKLRANSDIKRATFTDFDNYRPSYGAPAAFVGIPITEDASTVGALVLQLPVGEINKIMTGNNNWEADGLGESGETYLVGEDFFMRSISRFYLQDTIGYTQALVDLGVDKEEVDKMYRIGTTILHQRVKTEGVMEALAGKNETKVIEDYRFTPVLSSYAPLQIRDLNWVILSEIDQAEANIPINQFKKKVFIALCIIILLVTFLAMYLASRFVKPIEKLSDGVRRLNVGDYSQEIEIQSKDEFGELAASFNEMTHNIEKQQDVIAEQSIRNEKLLLNFLPISIANRLQKGEKNIADIYPNVSLIAIDIAGFSKLATEIGPAESVSLLNHLVEAFDEAAEKHQIEKIRTVGDTYFAACGMFHPRLDHAKKIFGFALEVRQLAAQFNINYNINLALHIGIHTGEVIAGIVGNEKFNYDLWGQTVNETFALKDIEEDNQIFVSDQVYHKLGEQFKFEKYNIKDASKLEFEVWKYAELRIKNKLS